jgi:hypothetical protein
MSNPRRHFEHNCAYFLTNRLARGLPLVSCDYINNILLGGMAKACEDYPNVVISNYLWRTNHYGKFGYRLAPISNIDLSLSLASFK